MAIIEHESAEPLPPLDILPAAAEMPEQTAHDQLRQAALELDIQAIEPDEQDHTYVIKKENKDIGAAAVYSRSVPVGADKEIRAVEVESLETNPANYHSSYLALLAEIMASDPELRSINGPPGSEMAAVANDLHYHLPLDWRIEYSLTGGPNRVEVVTSDPRDISGDLDGVTVSHSFIRTSPPA